MARQIIPHPRAFAADHRLAATYWWARVVRHPREAVFAACCLLVAAVSVHDALLLVVNHEVIQEVEQNPMGQWLLELQEGGVWLFVFVKLAGTAVVCATLITLYRHRTPLGLAAVLSIASFQMALLCYLTLV